MAAPLRIAIAGGTGGVGTTLAGRLARAGHAVALCSRDISSAKTAEAVAAAAAVAAGAGGAGSVAARETRAAVADADIIFFTFPSAQVGEAASLDTLAASLGDVRGKICVDACNALAFGPDGVSLKWDANTSVAEQWAARLPGAHIVKAFNTVGREVMADPLAGFASRPSLMFAGASEARDVVARLVADVGFVPEYVGPLRFARNLESLAVLWVHLGRVAKLKAASFVFQLVEQVGGAKLETAKGLAGVALRPDAKGNSA